MESPRLIVDPDSPDSIAIFVDAKFTMGSRAATEVKAYYGGVEWLRNQNVGVGGMIAVKQSRREYPDEDLYVYYLVVKRGGPALSVNITSSLNAMIQHAESHNVTNIKISLMAQKFNDPSFRALIDQAFENSSVTVKMINATCKLSNNC